MSDIVSMTAICNLCGIEMRPAPAFWDGFVRFFFTSFLAVVDLGITAAYLKVDL
jgi:hypothetical protein